MHSSRVYYPCILGVEMLEIRISLTSPLLVLRGGWEAGIMNKHTPIMDTLPTNVVSSRKRIRANDSSDDESQHEEDVIEFDPNWKLTWPRFIVLAPVDETQPLTKLSPFLVEKHIYGKFGTVHKVTKMRSGSLLIEATRPAQARNILDTTSFMDIEVKASSHRSLNTSKGVIRDHGRDLYDMSENDIVMELRDQGVEAVSRFILKKDGKDIKTNTLFITFATPTPPAKLRIGYYNVDVKLYIPNPLRCYSCQEFGHSRKYCKKTPRCWKCGGEGHDGGECTSESSCCVNCKGDHYSSSKNCPVWIVEKDIQRVKAEKAIPYGEARRLVTSSSPSSAPSSYANAVKVSTVKVTPKRSIECQTPDFWMYDNPSLLELSKRPSVMTRSTGSGTTRQVSPSSPKSKNKEANHKEHIIHKSPSLLQRQKLSTKENENRFNSLSSDVDESMEEAPSSPRPNRSTSRSRPRDRNISPVKYK